MVVVCSFYWNEASGWHVPWLKVTQVVKCNFPFFFYFTFFPCSGMTSRKRFSSSLTSIVGLLLICCHYLTYFTWTETSYDNEIKFFKRFSHGFSFLFRDYYYDRWVSHFKLKLSLLKNISAKRRSALHTFRNQLKISGKIRHCAVILGRYDVDYSQIINLNILEPLPNLVSPVTRISPISVYDGLTLDRTTR